MTPWIKYTLIGVFGTAVLFGGLSACAHRHHGGMMSEADMTQMRERFIDKASRELALDAAQKAKLGLLADAIKAQRSALMGDATNPAANPASNPSTNPRTNPRTELAALMAGSQFDRSRAQALVDSKTGALRDKAPAVVAAMADFFDSLQPAQQQKVRDFIARGRGHWRG